MPNFDVRVHSGTIPETWDDPRLNHRGNARHLYLRVKPGAFPAAVSVELRAVVDGVEAPLDGALGGDLFSTSRIAWSGDFPFAILPTSGQSSKVVLHFTEKQKGHQELCFRRDNGGAILVSFEVEPVPPVS